MARKRLANWGRFTLSRFAYQPNRRTCGAHRHSTQRASGQHNHDENTRILAPVLPVACSILGTPHINLNTAFQRPMADVFDINSSGTWAYAAVASTILKTPTPSLARAENGVKFAKAPNIKPRHSSAYWAKATPGFDFSDADQVPPAQFNKMLWVGLMGRKPYPVPGQSQT